MREHRRGHPRVGPAGEFPADAVEDPRTSYPLWASSLGSSAGLFGLVISKLTETEQRDFAGRHLSGWTTSTYGPTVST